MSGYSAFGLSISSEIELPELRVGRGEPTVRVTRAKGLIAPPLSHGRDRAVAVEQSAIAIRYRDAGVLVVRESACIEFELEPGVDDRVARLMVLGPGLALLLHQRGLLVLHASVAAIDGSGIAFVGDSGHGKSTIAAALHARGHMLVSDDIAALDTASDLLLVQPGFPQLKLAPDALRALRVDPESLTRLSDDDEKRGRPLAHGFATQPVPLTRVYALARGNEPSLEPLAPREAFVELLRHSYATRFEGVLDAPGAREHSLRALTGLAERVEVLRARRRRTFDQLEPFTEAIELDVRRTPRVTHR